MVYIWSRLPVKNRVCIVNAYNFDFFSGEGQVNGGGRDGQLLADRRDTDMVFYEAMYDLEENFYYYRR